MIKKHKEMSIVEKFFTLLGGMGTLASESFIHLLNKRTPATSDQSFLNYILVNHASIPDRTDYILDANCPSPLPYLKKDIQQQSLLQPEFFAILCNTAHYFYDELQHITEIPILHMPKLTIEQIRKTQPKCQQIGILATEGSIRAGIYTSLLEAAGLTPILPSKELQSLTNHLIYDLVKQGKPVPLDLFDHLLQETFSNGSQAIILGCTELSYIQENYFNTPIPYVYNPQDILVTHILQKMT